MGNQQPGNAGIDVPLTFSGAEDISAAVSIAGRLLEGYGSAVVGVAEV